MFVIKEDKKVPVKLWLDDVSQIEDSALQQVKNLAGLPFVHGVAGLPDIHMGVGAAVGSVIATHKALVPSAAGVDLGCGVSAVQTSLTASDLPESLTAIRSSIERGVPTGNAMHQRDLEIEQNWKGRDGLMATWKEVADKIGLKAKTEAQLGSLGGGNHFIELCLDENQQVWVMLHSGSRGAGNAIGRHFIEKAREECERWLIPLPDKDLAYLPEDTPLFKDYVWALHWAQDYAAENRKVMMSRVLKDLAYTIPKPFTLVDEAISCHHNYTVMENHYGRNMWITRKGAIRARQDDLGIIPGSMGQRSFIVRGKGNHESYCSCSHGAGRKMSRTAARKYFTVDDLKAQTEGVECRKDDAVVDEIPGAYKDLGEVMRQQQDLVEVVHTLKAVLCVKGA